MDKSNWIPVDEGLPEPRKDVLVQTSAGDMLVGFAMEGGLWVHLEPTRDVVAWMPLPEPYKKGE